MPASSLATGPVQERALLVLGRLPQETKAARPLLAYHIVAAALGLRHGLPVVASEERHRQLLAARVALREVLHDHELQPLERVARFLGARVRIGYQRDRL